MIDEKQTAADRPLARPELVAANTAAELAERAPAGCGEAQKVRQQLEQHLAAQAGLCTALERLADALPDGVDYNEGLFIAKIIYPTVQRAHEFEEQVLFPLLERSVPAGSLATTLDRLHGEHWEDESYAEEICHSLHDYVAERSRDEAGKLGYMLRGFFEGLRRHLAFEREHILPILVDVERKGA